ncbi:hypothetical protein ACWDOR_16270 [Streptosporangium canum]
MRNRYGESFCPVSRHSLSSRDSRAVRSETSSRPSTITSQDASGYGRRRKKSSASASRSPKGPSARVTAVASASARRGEATSSVARTRTGAVTGVPSLAWRDRCAAASVR